VLLGSDQLEITPSNGAYRPGFQNQWVCYLHCTGAIVGLWFTPHMYRHWHGKPLVL